MDRRIFLATMSASLGLPAMGWSEPSNKLRVGVIGHTGRGNFGHGLDTVWLRIPEAQIVAVADADEQGLAQAKDRLKVDRGFADYERMLKELKPDSNVSGVSLNVPLVFASRELTSSFSFQVLTLNNSFQGRGAESTIEENCEPMEDSVKTLLADMKCDLAGLTSGNSSDFVPESSDKPNSIV